MTNDLETQLRQCASGAKRMAPTLGRCESALMIAAADAIATHHIPLSIVLDGPPGLETGRFVDVETDAGHSICVGKWVNRSDGYWSLRIE